MDTKGQLKTLTVDLATGSQDVPQRTNSKMVTVVFEV